MHDASFTFFNNLKPIFNVLWHQRLFTPDRFDLKYLKRHLNLSPVKRSIAKTEVSYLSYFQSSLVKTKSFTRRFIVKNVESFAKASLPTFLICLDRSCDLISSFEMLVQQEHCRRDATEHVRDSYRRTSYR